MYVLDIFCISLGTFVTFIEQQIPKQNANYFFLVKLRICMQLASTLNNIFKLPNFAIHSNTIPVSVLTEEPGKRGINKGGGER